MTETSPTLPGPPPARARERPDVAWTIVDLLMIAVLTLFLAAPLVTLAVSRLAPDDMVEAITFPLLMLAFALTSVGWVAARHRDGWVLVLGTERPGGRDVLAGVGHGLAAFFVLNLVLGLLFTFFTELFGIDVQPVQEQIRQLADEPDQVPYLLVSVVIGAPLAEELFFRGLLYQWLRARVGVWLGIAVSALVFGFAHWEPGNLAGALFAVVSLSAVGAYLAWVLQRRGTIVAPVVMHATFNLLAAIWILQGLG